MSIEHGYLLSRFHYDALDRLTGTEFAEQPTTQRFYVQDRLSTEIQGASQYSIFQHGDRLLGQTSRRGNSVENLLFATDQQRSVLFEVEALKQHAVLYTPYGFRSTVGKSLGLMGFNGERPDPLTGHYLLGNGYRAFNPVLMRFNSPDSWSPFGSGGLNAYAYCEGEPVSRSDPTGHALILKALMLHQEANATPLGQLQKFAGMPHILEKIAGDLLGSSRVNFSKASSATHAIAQTIADPLGDLTPLRGKPLEAVARFLPGNDLVNFSLASKETQRTARAIQQPIWPDRDEGRLTKKNLNDLRRTALGEKPGHFPGEVLRDQHLFRVSKTWPFGADTESDALRYKEALIRKKMRDDVFSHQRERIRQGLSPQSVWSNAGQNR